MWKRILIVVLVAGAIAVALLVSKLRHEPKHVSGFIEAHEIRVGSRVGGRIKSVAAVEGASVKKGQLLIELEPYDLFQRRSEAAALLASRKAEWERLSRGYRAEEIAQYKAKRDQAGARLALLEAGPRKQTISVAEAQLVLAQAQLKLAMLNMERVKTAFQNNSATRDDFDRATDSLSVAEANLAVRKQELDALKEGSRIEDIEQAKAQKAEAEAALEMANTGFRAEEIASAKASMDAADASLKAIGEQIEELQVVSPIDGIVEAVELRPGDLIGPGAPALSIQDPADLWVRAYVPENLAVADGQQVKVTVDSAPKKEFEGKVTFIARQAEFTPGNVQTPEERSKQVFRIKVTLPGRDIALRAGMAADVWLENR